jgi:hypothetical protein
MNALDGYTIAFLSGMVTMAIIYFTTRRHSFPPNS